MLLNSLLPSVDLFYNQDLALLYQQDGATAHAAKSIEHCFNEENVALMEWSANSHDLYPI